MYLDTVLTSGGSHWQGHRGRLEGVNAAWPTAGRYHHFTWLHPPHHALFTTHPFLCLFILFPFCPGCVHTVLSPSAPPVLQQQRNTRREHAKCFLLFKHHPQRSTDICHVRYRKVYIRIPKFPTRVAQP